MDCIEKMGVLLVKEWKKAIPRDVTKRQKFPPQIFRMTPSGRWEIKRIKLQERDKIIAE
jgi:hypothetical protein